MKNSTGKIISVHKHSMFKPQCEKTGFEKGFLVTN
jgi:hypothetical protein